MSSSTTDRPADAGTTVDVLMPRMGTSMVEGTVVAWRVAAGDVVARDQVLCEVTTDKVDVECPAPTDGVVDALLVEEGETVDVGVVIARLGVPDDAPAASSGGASADPASAVAADPGAAGPVPADPVAASPADGRPGAPLPSSPADGRPGAPLPSPPPDPRADRRELLRRSSPVALRLAAEHGIDVRGLAGSGRGGRVTKRDVLTATERAAQAPMHTESPYRHDPSIPTAGAGGAPPAAATRGVRPAVPADPTRVAPPIPTDLPGAPPVVPTDLGGVPEPASRMRRTIGDAVRRSLDTAAHCTTVVECDMGRVERERRALGLTALPLVAHALVRTLREFPALNATFDGETVVRHGDRVHLGVAVSLGEEGLIAPVIHDAQDLSVEGLARRIRDVAARARSRALTPDEVHGGTFTITNPGAAGALLATPVITLPQVAILDLEAVVRRPVVLTAPDGTESIGIRPMVHLCMGWDHRALDGLYAAQFLTALRGRLEG